MEKTLLLLQTYPQADFYIHTYCTSPNPHFQTDTDVGCFVGHLKNTSSVSLHRNLSAQHFLPPGKCPPGENNTDSSDIFNCHKRHSAVKYVLFVKDTTVQLYALEKIYSCFWWGLQQKCTNWIPTVSRKQTVAKLERDQSDDTWEQKNW